MPDLRPGEIINQLIYQRETLKRQLSDTVDTLIAAYAELDRVQVDNDELRSKARRYKKVVVMVRKECQEMGYGCTNPIHLAAKAALSHPQLGSVDNARSEP